MDKRKLGAYLVGVFKVKQVYSSFKHVLADPEAVKDISDYAWFKSFMARNFNDDNAPWVKGSEEGSGLLKEAIPLSDVDDSQRWSKIACEFFKTTKGNDLDPDKKAVFQTVLTCTGERLSKLLSMVEIDK